MTTPKSIIMKVIFSLILSFQPILAMEGESGEPPNQVSWESFVAKNSDSPFAGMAPELIVYIKQYLDPESRPSLALTCQALQNIVYYPLINEFVEPGWEYLEPLHQSLEEMPEDISPRLRSIFLKRLMTVLGLHSNMIYEPKGINTTSLPNIIYKEYFNTDNHNEERLKKLCNQIIETPSSILSPSSFVRTYCSVLSGEYPIMLLKDWAASHCRWVTTHPGILEKRQNENSLFRYYLTFLGANPPDEMPPEILATDPSCSLFEVLKNYDTVKKLKNIPDLYDASCYDYSQQPRAVFGAIWKQILALDVGATLLSYRLAFLSRFAFYESSSALPYCQKAISLTRKTKTAYLDIETYFEAISQLTESIEFEHLITEIEQEKTAQYGEFCFAVSAVYRHNKDWQNEIKYLEDAQCIDAELKHPRELGLLLPLIQAYKNNAEYDKAISAYGRMIGFIGYEAKASHYILMAGSYTIFCMV